MKRYWKISLIFASLLLIGGLIYAQVPRGNPLPDDAPRRDEKTKQLLSLARSLYDEMSLPDTNATCRLSYSLRVTERGPNDSLYTRTNDVRYAGSAWRLQVESSELSLYQDSSVGVAVTAPTREIRIFPSSPSRIEATRKESMKTFRDELFANSEVAAYEVRGKEHRLRLIPNKAFRTGYEIEEVLLSLLPEERRLVSIEARFGPQAKYVSMGMSYQPVECTESANADRNSFPDPLERIFDSDGKLRSNYREYTVIDLRSR